MPPSSEPHRPAGEVWAVEKVDGKDGATIWREVTQDGWAIPLIDEQVEPPRRLVRRIAHPGQSVVPAHGVLD